MNSELQDQLTHYLPFVASTALVVGGFIAFRKWAAGGVCTDRVNLSGKTVIITGANTGIGLTAAKMLAKMNGHIILACRDVEKGKKAREKILKEFDKASVEVMKLDLSSLKSVREFAEEFKNKKISLDILINNAGIMNAPKGKTADGFELHIGINHLGHFLLTNLLLDKLVQSKGRVVTVSSSLHKRGNVNLHDLQWETTPYNGRQAYSASKSANILFTIELQRRLEGSGVEAFVLHPGVVGTELGRYASLRARYTFALLVRIFGKTSEQGCQTTVYAAISPSLNGKGGAYLGDCRIEEAAHHALDMETAKKLWEISEKLVRN